MSDDPRRIFSRSADRYLASTDHRTGPDLEVIRNVAAHVVPAVSLDVAAGAGHALLAAAPFSDWCIAVDITAEMLTLTRDHLTAAGIDRVGCLQAAAGALPVADGAVDLLLCRIAAHHFSSLPRFLAETARVLSGDGAAVIIDSVVPDDREAGAWLNAVESYRDPSHVRSFRVAEWVKFIAAAGLHLERATTFRRRHPFGEWARRVVDEDERLAGLEQRFLRAPDGIAATYRIEVREQRVVAYTDDKGIFVIRRTP